ncbi:MAG: single-stranded DNA-binding protein [Capnocytophaga sp.]|nr:MAG: single-stranded DNA-binding protein [Capnocytophaga sp.]
MNGTLNKVMLIGRLGSDVKLTYFEKDNCIGQVPLATDESYTDKATQQRVENTQWHNIVLYNKLAERVAQYAKKGDLLYVEGRLRTRQYQAQDGTTRYVTEVVALDTNFLSPKKGNPQEPSAVATDTQPPVSGGGVPF